MSKEDDSVCLQMNIPVEFFSPTFLLRLKFARKSNFQRFGDFAGKPMSLRFFAHWNALIGKFLCHESFRNMKFFSHYFCNELQQGGSRPGDYLMVLGPLVCCISLFLMSIMRNQLCGIPTLVCKDVTKKYS